MNHPMSALRLHLENLAHAGSGGVSHTNAGLGFSPAFFDFETCTIYPSRFADGRQAPMHLMDGLPEEVVIERSISGRVISVKATVVAGFERNGFFYTRTAAAHAAREWPL